MPTKDVKAICVHGVGVTPPDWSWDARRNLRAGLAANGRALWIRDAWWSPVADFYERSYFDAVQAHGAEGNIAQKLAIMDAGDVFLYRNNAHVRDAILEVLDDAYKYLHSKDVVIFAHSLGIQIVIDWLNTTGRAIGALHSFGNNLGLLNLGATFTMPEQLTAPGSWVDYWTPSDGLGFPLSAQPGFEHVDSVKVKIGSWATHWVGLDHTAYWGSKELWGDVIPRKLVKK